MTVQGGSVTGVLANSVNTSSGNPDPNQTTAGDPVNIANGNVVQDETDFLLPGIGLPLDLRSVTTIRSPPPMSVWAWVGCTATATS